MINEISSMRLDKWLVVSRMYKTRQVAKDMINGGKVKINGARVKVNRQVTINDVIVLERGNDQIEIKVLGLTEHRLSYQESLEIYQESAASIEKREHRKLTATEGKIVTKLKPTKKEYRDLAKFKQHNLYNYIYVCI